jgi:hypothetical protein
MPSPKQDKNTQNDAQKEGVFGAMAFSYSHATALLDGFMVDVSEIAREAGFLLPVTVTASLWGDINNIPEGSDQNVEDRLWNVLIAGIDAVHAAATRGAGNGNTIRYQVILTLPGGASEEESLYSIKCVIGPGDDEKPVLTLMQPHES